MYGLEPRVYVEGGATDAGFAPSSASDDTVAKVATYSVTVLAAAAALTAGTAVVLYLFFTK